MEQKPSRAANLLKRVQGSNVIVPVDPPKVEEQPQLTPPPVVDAAPPKEEYDINPKAETPPAPPVEEPKKDTIPKEFVPEDPTDEIDSMIDPKGTTGENFKKLRTKLKTLNTDHKKASEELETLRKKVTDYENGLAVPEVTQAQLDRIAQLEVYEKLYNFKASPVYQEKYAAPIRSDQEKLLSLAKDHQVDPEILNRAFAADSEAETNRILSGAFKDPLSALEAKGAFKNIKRLQAEALEAEKEPAQSLARMQEENDRIIAEKRMKANDAIVNVSKEAWSESLVHLRQDPRFPEITYREGDTEHNEKFVRPILTKAGQEYGRIVKTLAQHGLTEMPKDLGIAISRMTQLAHQSAAIAIDRDYWKNLALEREALIQQKTHLHRPGVTGNGNGTSGSSSTGAVGSANAGRRVLERVGGVR